VKSARQYIADAKLKLGKPRMTDRELGEALGYTQQAIWASKNGKMTDPIAIAIATIANVDPGEVLLVSRAERERNVETRAHLMAYAKKMMTSVSSIGVAIFAALTLGGMPAREARAEARGNSRF
jgi:DNA-binding XRE family transcriptional regulator